ncbi:MAG TPA: cyclic nucleotide-binding domain-containing protein [Candidatus Acetothermia bacterium]|nr:cyclic nucleotide-binding domain-containing protein [Candidatus Acetothermia bacterium]
MIVALQSEQGEPMAKNVVELLKDVPLFSSFSEKHLQAVVKTAKEMEFEPGKPIVREGDRSKVGFFLILDGQVEVRRGGQVLSRLGAGQFFGEMAVLDGQPRSADVVAVTPTKCLVLASWDIRALITTYPDIALELIGELTRRLRQTSMALSE